MSRGKTAGLLTMLILNLGMVACTGVTSQGPQEQERPAENQNPAQEDAEETAFETPETIMEETANEEKTMQ
jgi:hypothetical protein